MRLEVTQTLDASRDGLLIQRSEACEERARVWVVFPFDPGANDAAQPETPARVVRVEAEAGRGYRVALRFESPRTESTQAVERERRGESRIPLALPILVRHAETPWPGESMTQDISRSGARFETSRIYAVGDTVLAKIPCGEWSKTGEIAGRVVRVEAMEDLPGPAPLASPETGASAIFTCVAVKWIGESAARRSGKPVSRSRRH